MRDGERQILREGRAGQSNEFHAVLCSFGRSG